MVELLNCNKASKDIGSLLFRIRKMSGIVASAGSDEGSAESGSEDDVEQEDG
jgi:hypothetical protein